MRPLIIVGGAALLFWAGVSLIASVGWAIVLVALWFAAAAFFLKSNLALVGLSVALCVGGAEALLRVPLVARVADPSYRPHMEFSNTEPIVHPDADLGYRPAKSRTIRAVRTRGDVLVYDVVYGTDANGYRKDGLPPVNGKRVLVAGDSFAYGIGLNDGDTLGRFLKERGFDAVNIGAQGYGPHQTLRQLELGVPAFDVLLLTIIDAYPPRAAGRRSWQHGGPRYEIEGEALVLRGTHQHSDLVQNLRAGSRLFRAYEAATIVEGEERRFVAIMRRIREISGGKLLGVYYSGSDRMRALLREAGVEFIDVARELPRDQRHYIAHDTHPTGLLNAEIARLVAARIE